MTNIISLLDARLARQLAEQQKDLPNGMQVEMQLALPFGALDPLIIVDVRDFLGQEDFANFCIALGPSALVDLRVAPRLDFVKPVRKQAFELFDAFELSYGDVLGRLSISSYEVEEDQLNEIALFIDQFTSKTRDKGPVLALIDSQGFAQRCHIKLNSLFDVALLERDAVRRTAADGARQQM